MRHAQRSTANAQAYGNAKAAISFLSDDDLRERAPSVFATTAHDSRSERFSPIPTIAIVNALRKEGFDVAAATQSKARDDDRREFTKHLLRFRRVGVQAVNRLGQLYAEVVLKNANDGSSSYVLDAGLWRLVCLNGMTVSDQQFASVRVSHMGNVTDKVIDGTYTVLDEATKAITVAEHWQDIRLDRREQIAFAEGARVARFGDAGGKVTTPITADQLLTPRRSADAEPTLWATFNRVQENVIRGGLHGVDRHYDADRRRQITRRVTTRQINGIDQDQKLNKALWTMAEVLAARH